MIYPGETVRLAREVSEAGLATGAHCEFVRIVSNGNEEGDAASAEVKWYSGGGAHSAIVPLDNVEP
ncbi:MAG TPA: hypothetical protein VI488_22025, partial [Candidatus Angelobacter sp.]